MKTLRIGEVAKESRIGVETIRYYEREGLLTVPERNPSGYRQYDGSAIARLEFIRRTKELGFTLGEIKELLDLSFDVNTTCVHVRERAARKMIDIEERIRSLQKMRRSLEKLMNHCESRDSMERCPLLEGLDRHREHGPNGA